MTSLVPTGTTTPTHISTCNRLSPPEDSYLYLRKRPCHDSSPLKHPRDLTPPYSTFFSCRRTPTCISRKAHSTSPRHRQPHVNRVLPSRASYMWYLQKELCQASSPSAHPCQPTPLRETVSCYHAPSRFCINRRGRTTPPRHRHTRSTRAIAHLLRGASNGGVIPRLFATGTAT